MNEHGIMATKGVANWHVGPAPNSETAASSSMCCKRLCQLAHLTNAQIRQRLWQPVQGTPAQINKNVHQAAHGPSTHVSKGFPNASEQLMAQTPTSAEGSVKLTKAQISKGLQPAKETIAFAVCYQG
mmetsp:Transcript_11635/g.17863  ORF Transcript_11635/g.17863 Transcript_11635/m.17863 type:complete len:127 (-) Transcript_11635:292-672(-)